MNLGSKRYRSPFFRALTSVSKEYILIKNPMEAHVVPTLKSTINLLRDSALALLGKYLCTERDKATDKQHIPKTFRNISFSNFSNSSFLSGNKYLLPHMKTKSRVVSIIDFPRMASSMRLAKLDGLGVRFSSFCKSTIDIFYKTNHHYIIQVFNICMFGRRVFAAMGSLCWMFVPAVMCEKKRQVYIWGNGKYQARPDATLQFQNFLPKKINNLPDNLIALEFGQFFEGGIDTAGNLYIWDARQIDANTNSKDNIRDNIRLLQENVRSVRFTPGYIWTLSKSGTVCQWPIQKTIENSHRKVQIGSKRQIPPLKGTIQLQTGQDHLITLNEKGQVFAMGDDTLGQCGQADQDRNTFPPFIEKRHKYPKKVKALIDIVSIKAGANHNLAVDQMGNLFGWGSNSSLQISHEEEFSKPDEPLICSYYPLRIHKSLQLSQIKQIVSGQQFSFIITQNRGTGNCEVFSLGNNLKGQLGVGQYRHIKDITKVQQLSNFIYKNKGERKKVTVQQIACGNNHCLALLNIGYMMEWGDNQFGQLGNKKRSSAIEPIVQKFFSDMKVVGVFASHNTSAVIVQQDDTM